MPTSRLEAFSDGVIAIAITLLILDVHVPVAGEAGHASLPHELGRQWPQYFAYVTSFFTIGIVWINHHALIRRIRQADHVTLVLNLLLLMTISVIPFTTALIAEYLREGDGQTTAALVYGLSCLAMGVAFLFIQTWMLYGGRAVLEDHIDDGARGRIMRRNLTGLAPYLVATALAPVSAYATVGICLAVAVFFALPVTTSE